MTTLVRHRFALRFNRHTNAWRLAKLLIAALGGMTLFIAAIALLSAVPIVPVLAVFVPFGSNFGWVIFGGLVAAVLILLKKICDMQ